VEEFIRVLAYEKFGLKPAAIAPFIADLQQISEFIEARAEIHEISEDPTDNIFLSRAVDGKVTRVLS